MSCNLRVISLAASELCAENNKNQTKPSFPDHSLFPGLQPCSPYQGHRVWDTVGPFTLELQIWFQAKFLLYFQNCSSSKDIRVKTVIFLWKGGPGLGRKGRLLIEKKKDSSSEDLMGQQGLQKWQMSLCLRLHHNPRLHGNGRKPERLCK